MKRPAGVSTTYASKPTISRASQWVKLQLRARINGRELNKAL
jgi:hypothetical protein